MDANGLQDRIKLVAQPPGANMLQLAKCQWDAIESTPHAQVSQGSCCVLECSDTAAQNRPAATAKSRALELADCRDVLSISLPKQAFGAPKSVHWDFVICNPPFFAGGDRPHGPSASFGGTSSEMATDGGEEAFVKRMIKESAEYAQHVGWFTCMLGKKTSMMELQSWLQNTRGIAHCETAAFFQGHTTRWGIAWTFSQSILSKSVFNSEQANRDADLATVQVALPATPGAEEILNANECRFAVDNTSDTEEVWGRLAAACSVQQVASGDCERFAGHLADVPFGSSVYSEWLQFDGAICCMRIAHEKYWTTSSVSSQGGSKRARTETTSSAKSLPLSTEALVAVCTVHKDESAGLLRVSIFNLLEHNTGGVSFAQWAVSVKQNVQRSNRFWRRRAKLGEGGNSKAPRH